MGCIPENKQVLVVDTIDQITPSNDKLTNYLLWNLLHSDFINWYCYGFIFRKAIRTMHFENTVTNRIPIPIYSIISELFFATEFKSANKETLKHLGDLKPITDSMSDEEKLAVIQSEFERLYNPNHPVRNNLETLDSIEEVRIIKEALK